MKTLILSALLTIPFIAGCAYNSTSITAQGNISYSGTNTVDKPVRVDTSPTLQGNVPVQGGTVSNPTMTVTPEKQQ